jgi:CubicO group peptidase (beta-lactamase class C family)
MTLDTIFDLASLSKPIGCATSVLVLIDRGKIDLDAPVAKYIPEFGNNGKEKITVRMLLLHRGGLIPDNPMSDYVGTHEEMVARIYSSKPKWDPGTHFAYTDVGFIVLGELVERVSGKPLDQFAHDEVFAPLGMTDTSYKPPASWKPRIAPTEKRKGAWIVGEVHDPRAYALGIAGHAGVFSTARDVSKWVTMLNAGGEAAGGKRILSERIVEQMLKKDALPEGTGARGLGVDIDSSFASVRGKRFDKGTTFGHTGWTGTSYWSDPVNDIYVILLTNRVHPDGKGDVKRVRSEIATIVAESLLGPIK